MPKPRLLTLEEAADRLGVHYMTAYRYVRTGRLPAQRDQSRWTVSVADVERLRRGSPARRKTSTTSTAPLQLAQRLVAADEGGAWMMVEGALVSRMAPPEILLDLLVPALRAIGEGWASGTLSIADEHRATAVATRIIGRLGPRFNRRGRPRGTVVLGEPAGEEHALPSAITSDFIRGAGFQPMDLGADTPAESFVDAALAADRLLAVLIGVTVRGREAALADALGALRAAGIRAPVLVGGAAIPDEGKAIALGFDGWSGRDARSVVTSLQSITRSRSSDARPEDRGGRQP